jgi:hypothetical protein
MTHQDHTIHPISAIERSATPRRSAWQRGFGKAQVAILFLLAAVPPVSLWSPGFLGGGVIPTAV